MTETTRKMIAQMRAMRAMRAKGVTYTEAYRQSRGGPTQAERESMETGDRDVFDGDGQWQD